MFAQVSAATTQIVGASVAAVVVILIGYVARFVPRVYRAVVRIESNTNGVMAGQFMAVRDDIATLKREFSEVADVKRRLELAETALKLLADFKVASLPPSTPSKENLS